jgi:hypothetical protein
MDKEPMECVLADLMVEIMRKWMPEDGEMYNERQMLWGRVHQEMHDEIRIALRIVRQEAA